MYKVAIIKCCYWLGISPYWQTTVTSSKLFWRSTKSACSFKIIVFIFITNLPKCVHISFKICVYVLFYTLFTLCNILLLFIWLQGYVPPNDIKLSFLCLMHHMMLLSNLEYELLFLVGPSVLLEINWALDSIFWPYVYIYSLSTSNTVIYSLT